MEPNEMERWDNPDDNGWMNPHSDGEWVRYSDAMQIITTLQAKMEGMIPRPKVEVVEVNSFDDYEVRINGETFKRFSNQPNSAWANNYAKALTQALGMEGGEG